jgi:glyoxylase-like metal-dependent hydrolase (beta-lactamase superfamily II)
MALKIQIFILGALENNTYLVWDTDTRQAVVIDPSFNVAEIIEKISNEKLNLQAVWLTHGHFDHFAGAPQLLRAISHPVDLMLHEKDFTIWEDGGESALVGCVVDQSVEPNILLKDFQIIHVGSWSFKVLPTPGHTPGHVTFYCPKAGAAFCGDVLFRYSIGRADLTGGDYFALMNSINTQILTMPPDTILYSGHGENSTIRDQLQLNPFITLHTPRPGSHE